MWNEPNLNPDPEGDLGRLGSADGYVLRDDASRSRRGETGRSGRVVTSAGYAGMTAETVDPLRTYKYSDGKCPLDFVEVRQRPFLFGTGTARDVHHRR